MKKIGYLIMSSVLLAGFGAQAQDQERAPFCGTDSPEMLEFVNSNPEALRNRAELEKFTAEYLKNNAHSKKSGQKIIIPIVFHLIYDNKGKGLIPDEQVYNALETINTDFHKLNADTASTIAYFRPRAAMVDVEFRIAKIDPNNNCTDGITRHEIDATNSAGENVKRLVDAVQWDPKKYMNVWVVNNIASGAGGYAYYPGTAPSGGYGVLIRASQFGYGGVAGSQDGSVGSLTHELGHCFNLSHVWGNSNTPGASSNCGTSFTDNVDDTPKTEGNQSCNTSKKPCAGDTNLFANVQNYMDYSFCYTMFTEGQKARMLAALNSSVLNSLFSDANLIATGTDDAYAGNPCAPDARNIMSNNKFICSGKTVKYYDVTTNSRPTSREWTFPGGTPSTSTDSSVTVTYNTPGNYDVTLVVSNPYGSDTITKTDMVYVLDNAPSQGIPYTDGFEAGTFTDNGYTLTNNGGITAWEQVSTAAHTGTKSLRLLNSSASNGVTNAFTLPAFNLTGKTKASLVFYMAHATRNTTNQSGTATTDKLTVLAQGNCNGSWNLKYSKSDTTLRTTKTLASSGTYVPKPADWEKVTIDMKQYAGFPSVVVQFTYYSSGGNAMYIDDINVVEDPAVLAVSDVDMARELDINVYPNPVENNSTSVLSFNLNKDEKVRASIFDVLGREVSVIRQEATMNPGQHQLQITTMPAGVYYIKLNVGAHSFTQKVVMN